MDIDLEQVMVAKEVLTALSKRSADCVVINLLSGHKPLVDFVTSEVKAVKPDAVVTHQPDLINLPKLLAHVRGDIEGNETLMLMNVSHELGWPHIEICEINLVNATDLDERESVFGGDSSVHIGKPFYDNEVL
ncbi:hypothetical protein [Pseudoalteromonas nigrifaciens]|jgi:hypothetical protein|uniref:hypothetical protein n=1 Tax=Pseudoalteromonas nigrifaciens TaxID=28109 RepID=UPI003FD11400